MILSLLLIMIFIAIMTVLSFMLAKHYIDPAESNTLTVISFTIALTIGFLNLLMIPLDIIVASDPFLILGFNFKFAF